LVDERRGKCNSTPTADPTCTPRNKTVERFAAVGFGVPPAELLGVYRKQFD
jgi:hypothetical protein